MTHTWQSVASSQQTKSILSDKRVCMICAVEMTSSLCLCLPSQSWLIDRQKLLLFLAGLPHPMGLQVGSWNVDKTRNIQNIQHTQHIHVRYPHAKKRPRTIMCTQLSFTLPLVGVQCVNHCACLLSHFSRICLTVVLQLSYISLTFLSLSLTQDDSVAHAEEFLEVLELGSVSTEVDLYVFEDVAKAVAKEVLVLYPRWKYYTSESTKYYQSVEISKRKMTHHHTRTSDTYRYVYNLCVNHQPL